MRRIMLPVLLVAAVLGLGTFTGVGCGGDSGGEKDLSAHAKNDLLPAGDSAMPAPGCAATLACENACYADTMKNADEQQQCSDDCDSVESDEGKALEKAIYDCIYAACDAREVVDAGMNGVCAYNPANGNKFVTPGPCEACLMMAEQGSCMDTVSACHADTSGE